MTDDELFEDFYRHVDQWDHENLKLSVQRSPHGKYVIQWCGGEFWWEGFDPAIARVPGGLVRLKTLAIDRLRASRRLRPEE